MVDVMREKRRARVVLNVQCSGWLEGEEHTRKKTRCVLGGGSCKTHENNF